MKKTTLDQLRKKIAAQNPGAEIVTEAVPVQEDIKEKCLLHDMVYSVVSWNAKQRSSTNPNSYPTNKELAHIRTNDMMQLFTFRNVLLYKAFLLRKSSPIFSRLIFRLYVLLQKRKAKG